MFTRLYRGAAPPLRPQGRLAEFAGASGWLNSPPLEAADLDGKVVLVDFWTYTCINWLRTLSYVRAWAERYDEQGHGVASRQRLYQLVRQRRPIADRTLEITFLGRGVEAYVFTFG